MRRSGIIGRVVLATLVATALVLVGLVPAAHADTVAADGDTVQVGNQSSRDLGTVAPGASLSADVSFQLHCATKNHVNDNQSVALAYNSAQSTVPSGGSMSATAGRIGSTSAGDPGVPNSWPEDTQNCPTGSLTVDGTNSTVSISAPTAPGSYTFQARYAVDLVPDSTTSGDDNNSITGSAPVVTFTLTVAPPSDTAAPETTIDSRPAPLTNSTSASFSFSSSEANSTFACSLNGSDYSTCTSPQSYSSLGQGGHTFSVKATDAAGNTDSSPASASWTVDSMSPDTSITSGPSGLTGTDAARFEFTSSEAGTFACSLDSAAFTACISPQDYAALAQGGHTFDVKAIDAAGNSDATPARRSWTVDTVAPDTTITAGPSGLTRNTSADFEFSSEAGSTFECSLDGRDFTSCSSPQSYGSIADGGHSFEVRAADAAGNTDTSAASRTWTVDATPPAVSTPNLDEASDTGESAIDNKTTDNTPSFSGTAEAGALVELLRAGTIVDSTTASESGTWSFTSAAIGDGSHIFGARATDEAGNTAGSETLTVLVDTASPGITFASRTGANTNGWNNGDVLVQWTCTDTGSGAVAAGVSDKVSTEGVNQSATGTCTDVAGNSADATETGINIDTTAPVARYTSASPAPNGASWYRTDVTATFSATDALSGFGIAGLTTTGAATTSGEGTAVTVASPTFTDLAGNASTIVNSAAFSIDQTMPGITFASRTGANTNGWNNGDVTVQWSCSDELSGPAAATASDTVSTEGANQSATGTCTDVAGNSADATETGINIDTTAPVARYTSASPAPNSASWYRTDVTATFTATDALSGFGIAGLTTTGTSTTSGEGTAVTVASPVFTDLAGNHSATVNSAAFDIDTTEPTNITISGGPSHGASYLYGSVPAAPGATCSADDALSGVATCTVTGYSTTVGPHTITATATDRAGNSYSVFRNYEVTPWTTKGFYQPVDMNGVVNTVKAGSTVPFKFEVFAGADELTSTSAVTGFSSVRVTCTTGAVEDSVEVVATGGTSLRYDGTAGQFVYNWKTPTTTGCYKTTVTMEDGSSITALFKLR